MTATRIILFAKAPLPGFAKTRLAPVLGDEGAAQVARRLLDHALREATEASLRPAYLSNRSHAGGSGASIVSGV